MLLRAFFYLLLSLLFHAGLFFVENGGLPPAPSRFSSNVLADLESVTPLLIAYAGIVAFWFALPWIILSSTQLHFSRKSGYPPTAVRCLGLFFSVQTLILMANAEVDPNSLWAFSIITHSTLQLRISLMSLLAIWLILKLRDSLGIKSEKYPNDRSKWVPAAWGLIVFLCTLPWLLQQIPPDSLPRENNVSAAPDIILVGIDSLAQEQLEAYETHLPTLQTLKRNAIHFSDAITPIARTFPAWMATLSGLYPHKIGATDNLVPSEKIDKTGLLSRKLKVGGYQTMFAMDERQFANIDETYSFDVIVGPKMGILDFVAATTADLPTNNLFRAIPGWGETFFHYSFLNRATGRVYHPDRFSKAVARQIKKMEPGRPLFLATHHCLAHIPYVFSDHENDAGGDQALPTHLKAVKAVDAQIKHLLTTLRDFGRLENALVIYFSDHGEGLGRSKRNADNFLREQELPFVTYGHGGNVFSSDQNNIVLGAVRYQNGNPVHAGRASKFPASLVDIFPTALAVAGVHDEHVLTDGINLLSASLEHDQYTPRARGLQSGFLARALNVPGSQINKAELLNETMSNFRIRPDGIVYYAPPEVPGSADRSRAVLLGEWQLTIVAGFGSKHAVLTDWTRQQHSTNLRSGLASEAPLEALWEAGRRIYGDAFSVE